MPTDTADAESAPVTLTLASSLRVRDISWVWHRFVARRMVTFLDGDPGDGKTQIAIDLAVRVAGGYLMPDGTSWYGLSRGAPVVYLDLERQVEIATLPRLYAAGYRSGQPVHIWPEDVALSMPNQVDKVIATVQAVGGALVIVDTLVRSADEGLKLGDYQDASRISGAWDRVARETGAAVLLINHRVKSPVGDAMSRGYGSKGGLAGVARSMLGVSIDHGDSDAEDRRYYLEVVKASYRKIPPKLAYRIVRTDVDGVDDAGVPVVVETSRVDWLPDAEVVTAGLAKRRDRESSEHRETMIALRVIGDGFTGTRLDLQAALVSGGITEARAGAVQRRVAVAQRASGARNAHTWVVRDAIASGASSSGARVPDGARVPSGADALDAVELDDLGPMVADVGSRVWPGV